VYAIIKTGGKQYKVSPGDVLDIERIKGETGDTVEFDTVITVADGDSVQVGTPTLDGVSVTAELEEQYRGKKIVVFKIKRRKGYRRRQGHRQDLSRVRVLEINQGKAKKKSTKADAEPAEEAAPASDES
jgi:large subunit ribosomal protein L21